MSVNLRNHIQFGVYYKNEQLGLIRTVCRVTDISSNVSSIAFVKVGKGGYASETFIMEEEKFKETFSGLEF